MNRRALLRSVLFAALVCAAAVLSACEVVDELEFGEPPDVADSGADEADSGNSDKAESYRLYINDYTAAYADSACATVFRCPEYAIRATVPTAHGPWPMRGLYARFESEDVCVEELRESGPFSARKSLIRAIDAGRIRYNQDAGSSCLDDIRYDESSGCANPFALSRDPTDCPGLLDGESGAKQECVLDAECASGECELGGDGICLGRCTDPTSSPTLAREGESCVDSPCGEGLVCSIDPGGFDWRCIPHASKREGEPCIWRTECELGLHCAFNGVCQPVQPFLGPGESGCLDWGRWCEPGFVCGHAGDVEDFSNVACIPALDVGDECIWDEECSWGTHCTGSVFLPGTCQPRKQVGEACDLLDLDCGELDRCEASEDAAVCQARFAHLEACVHPDD